MARYESSEPKACYAAVQDHFCGNECDPSSCSQDAIDKDAVRKNKRTSSWVQEYASWHQKTLARVTPDNWKDFKYLILYCPPEGDCHGTSDRLQPVVWHLRMAERTNRLFFIHWDHPYPLEEFLVPAGRINWSTPDWLADVTQPRGLPSLRVYRPNNGAAKKYENITKYDNAIAVTVGMKIGWSTAIRYDEFEGSGAYASIYSEAFNLLFKPSPPIAKILQERMQSAGLTRGMYAVAHSRVLYFNETASPGRNELRAHVTNAVNCASELMPGVPIYFASDSAKAKEEVRAYATETNRSVIAFTDMEPVHLDDASSEHTVPDYYPIFVDMYIMAYGRCIAYGVGGYGKWTNLMSSSVACATSHTYRKCEQWVEQ